jgi:hypothetical protein
VGAAIVSAVATDGWSSTAATAAYPSSHTNQCAAVKMLENSIAISSRGTQSPAEAPVASSMSAFAASTRTSTRETIESMWETHLDAKVPEQPRNGHCRRELICCWTSSRNHQTRVEGADEEDAPIVTARFAKQQSFLRSSINACIAGGWTGRV